MGNASALRLWAKPCRSEHTLEPDGLVRTDGERLHLGQRPNCAAVPALEPGPAEVFAWPEGLDLLAAVVANQLSGSLDDDMDVPDGSSTFEHHVARLEDVVLGLVVVCAGAADLRDVAAHEWPDEPVGQEPEAAVPRRYDHAEDRAPGEPGQAAAHPEPAHL